MSLSFFHRYPLTKLILRNGAMGDIAQELSQLGIQRPMVLHGDHARDSIAFKHLERALAEVSWVSADSVPPHSSVALVEKLTRQARHDRVDGFITLGGGSTSDTAKAVALLLAEGGRLADHASRFTPPDTLVVAPLNAPKLPIVAIPCTASGAEANAGLGISDGEGHKLLFSDIKLVSRLIVIDPQATADVPAGLLCATGINGLAHCLEGLYSKQRSPIAEAMALDAIARFTRVLPRFHGRPDDLDLRAELFYAAHLSGQVMINARTCLHHAICHAVGAYAGVPHGEANAVMLPHVLGFNAEVARDALSRAAAAAGWGETPEHLIGGLRDLREALGLRSRLRDIGVAEGALEPIAKACMGERGLYVNPRRVAGPETVLEILQAAY